MARKPRVAPGGWIYHILNRSVGKIKLFRRDEDFLAFERVMAEAMEKHPIRILSYCMMSNHWHFVVWPYKLRLASPLVKSAAGKRVRSGRGHPGRGGHDPASRSQERDGVG